MLSIQPHNTLMHFDREVPLDGAYQTHATHGRTNERTCAPVQLSELVMPVTDQAVTSP